MSGRDLEARDAAERIDQAIGYIARSKEGWGFVAADIADALWALMPDLVERHMPETTHLVRAGYWPGTPARAGAQVPYEDNDIPDDDVEDDVPF